MFGFSSFSQVPYATIPRKGVPALVEIYGEVLIASTSNLGVQGTASTGITGELIQTQINSVNPAARYSITGQSIATEISPLSVIAKGSVSLVGNTVDLYTGDLRTRLSIRLIGQNIYALQNNLAVSAKGNVVVGSQELQALLSSVVPKANATGIASSQLITSQLNGVEVTGKANVRPYGILINATNNTPLVWSIIVDEQNPDWHIINAEQLGTWVIAGAASESSWAVIDNGAPTGWILVDDENNVIWQRVLN